MMDDHKLFAPSPSPSPSPAATDAVPGVEQSAAAPAPQPVVSQATVRFQSCRWRATPDQGAFCTHRDVLPFAGKEGFSADSWCGDCGFFKLRRTPKKRDYSAY